MRHLGRGAGAATSRSAPTRRRLPRRRTGRRRARRSAGPLAAVGAHAPGAAPRPHQRARRRRPGARGRARRTRRGRPPRWRTFVGPPHRIELVGDADGVRWFNDSKATTPHAASVAIRAFDHVVLIAGGLQQGPRPRARWPPTPERVRAVVAIGEAADVIADDVRRHGAGRRAPTRWPTPSSAPRRPGAGPATSCCCRRAAPASTGTPTAATRPAATTSGGWSPQRIGRRIMTTLEPTRVDAIDARRPSTARPLDGGDHPPGGVGRRRRQRGARAAARRQPAGAPGGRAAVGQAAGQPAAPGVWDVQRGPAPAAYYVIGVVVADVRDARAGDGAVGVGRCRGGQGQQPVPHLQPPGDVGRRSASSG